ncbi:MAG: IS66 family transposase, partial [Acidimicrobiales bacterium]
QLARRIAALEARAQGSLTSSLPPSSDRPKERAEATKSRAERRAEEQQQRKTARRRGKQPGAGGKNLQMTDQPDHVVVHEPGCCAACGEDLSSAPMEGVIRRQVFDVPDHQLTSTEHRAVRRRCECGTLSVGALPDEARAPACYGPNVRAMTLYLLHAQHLPVERTAKAVSAMLGADVSTGFVAGLAAEAADRLGPFLSDLEDVLATDAVVHADETSDQVRTTTWWLHVVASERYTHLFASPTRGKDAPDAAGILGRVRGVMVHDRLAMYFNYRQVRHAICGAHILRELSAVGVRFDQGWANAMAALLTETNDACHEARATGRCRLPRRTLHGFLARYDALVADGLTANPQPHGRGRDALERKSFNLACALRDLRTEATRFAKDLSVPFTNNEAERSLRMAKLHRKISGCFQSEDHMRHFAAIRSYLDTARKHGVGALDVLGQLFRGDPWVIPAPT